MSFGGFFSQESLNKSEETDFSWLVSPGSKRFPSGWATATGWGLLPVSSCQAVPGRQVIVEMTCRGAPVTLLAAVDGITLGGSFTWGRWAVRYAMMVGKLLVKRMVN